jgi:opacity protein-like surface antigen
MRLRTVVLSGLIVLALPAAADAAPQAWYLGFGAGWTTLGSVGFNLRAPSAPLSGKVDFGDNAAVDLTAGYRFEMPLRLETEIQFADYDASKFQPNGLGATALGGDASNLAFFANAIYDFPISDLFSLSAGFGLGADQFDPAITAAGFRISNSQTAFAWHLLVGLTVPLSDKIELEGDYRYQEIDGTNHTFFAAQTSPFSLGSKNTQSFMLSLRWYVAG